MQAGASGPPEPFADRTAYVVEYTGWDLLRSFLPGRMQARWLAERAREIYGGNYPPNGLAVRLPDGHWHGLCLSKTGAAMRFIRSARAVSFSFSIGRHLVLDVDGYVHKSRMGLGFNSDWRSHEFSLDLAAGLCQLGIVCHDKRYKDNKFSGEDDWSAE